MSEIKDLLTERAAEIQRSASSSVSDFARRVDMDQVTVSNYLNGKRRMSADFLYKILLNFPDVSAEWLMRGEGNMLKSKAVEQNGTAGNAPISDDYAKLKDEFMKLKGKHEQLREIYEGVYEIIKKQYYN